jgi:ABC-type amino acid transport substrate-binding protein
LEIVIVDARDMPGMATSGTWDIAMPSSAVIAESQSFAPSDPYYSFPVFELVPVASTASVPGDLAGLRLCVVGGSAAEAWIAGRYAAGSTTPIVAPPVAPTIRTEPSDQACLDAVASGDVDGMTTATLSQADLSVRPSLRVLGGGPVLTEPRTIVAPRSGADPSGLVGEINQALVDLRSDRTLANASRNRFGGQDLTSP